MKWALLHQLVPQQTYLPVLQFIDACYHQPFDEVTYSMLCEVLPHQGFAYGTADLNTGLITRYLNKTFPLQYYDWLPEAYGRLECPLVKKWVQERKPMLLSHAVLHNPRPRSLPAELTLRNLAIHGVNVGLENRVMWFVFTDVQGPWLTLSEPLLRMVTPHLHAALYSSLLTDVTGIAPQRTLTGREEQTLYWLADGNSAAQIAEILGISIHTVRVHVRNLLRKLHAANIPHAIMIGVRTGVLGATRRAQDFAPRSQVVRQDADSWQELID